MLFFHISAFKIYLICIEQGTGQILKTYIFVDADMFFVKHYKDSSLSALQVYLI